MTKVAIPKSAPVEKISDITERKDSDIQGDAASCL